MEIWLDGVDLKMVEYGKELGLLHGVTTNPSILAKAGQRAEDILDALLSSFSGPIAVQVTEQKAPEMIELGKDLSEYSPRFIVKVPVTEEGIHAIARLTHAEVPTMGTAVFTPMQALLAAQAGADYIAPYFSHIGEGALDTLATMQHVVSPYPTKIIVAALENPQDVIACAQQGMSAVTLKEALFRKCLEAPQETYDHLARFEKDWSSALPSQLLPTRELIQ